ncbi:MAG TPA: penicillin-binding transpeptidase domain-containing protein, partial [Patescibacteria group bacterium]|nr:penicillin-binding transpeptidase domain-containing protein [Patescibacteria group bacterium]
MNRKKYKKNPDPFFIDSETPVSNKLQDTSYKLEWTENSYIADQGDKDSMRLTFDFSYLRKIAIFLALMILILLGRAGWLQVARGDHYRSMAQGNRIRVKSIESPRGIIYDRDGRELVHNVANFMLYLVPGDLPEDPEKKKAILSRITDILGSDPVQEKEITRESIQKKIQEVEDDPLLAYQPLFLTDNIEYEKAISLYLETQDMPGVILSNKSRRQYLNQVPLDRIFASSTQRELREKEVLPAAKDRLRIKTLSHILGYTGKIDQKELQERSDYSSIDYIGKTGLEYTWEEQLKGKKGKKQVEVNALGKEKRVISKEGARDGNNLVLSLDFSLQAQVEGILKKQLADKEVKKAAVVVMDPRNGEVLSLASTPGYNNNVFAQGISSEQYQEILGQEDNSLFNRVISGEYPSGSTIKPVIAAAALEEGIVSANTTVNSTGGIRVGEWFFPDWRAGGHGITDVRKAIAQSVN